MITSTQAPVLCSIFFVHYFVAIVEEFRYFFPTRLVLNERNVPKCMAQS